ncbi:MAG: N-acetylmuramoyl-L-alanine amidase [Desulfocucumaceae bacterium]
MPLIKAFRLRVCHLALAALLVSILYGSWVKVFDIIDRRQIEALSTVLAGRLIVVDPGHGGIDSGSSSPTGTHEEDITLEVSRKLSVLIGQSGAAVIMTRESDMWLAEPDAPHKKRSDLTKRVEIANRNNADIFVSIHVNSFMYDRGQRGAQTFSQPGSEEGKILSRFIQDELSRVLGNTSRKPKQIDYFIRHCKVPAVIVEIGFLSNPAEEKLLLDPTYQEKTAFAIYCGIVRYIADREARALNPEPQSPNEEKKSGN